MADSVMRNVTVQLHLPGGGETTLVEFDGAEVEISALELRRALIRTHVVHNIAVAYYCGKIREWLRAGAGRNASEVGRAKAEYIREMFPEGADAASASNASRSKYGPLTDPNSVGDGFGALADDDALASINAAFDELVSDPRAIERKAIRDMVMGTGRPPGWVEKADTESGLTVKRWPWDEKARARFDAWVREKRPKSAGARKVLVDARVLGRSGRDHFAHFAAILGMTPDAMSARGISAEFGRGAFAQAASRMATDLSWRARRREEQEKQVAALAEKYGELQSTDWWRKLDAYEGEAAARYAKESGHAPKQGYRLGDGGELKGWRRIRKAWLKRRWKGAPPSYEELLAIRNDEQKRRPQEFGDHQLFNWLARPENWELWDGCDADDEKLRASSVFDRVGVRARYTREARRLKSIAFTWPDPLLHPLWVAYGENGGSNNLAFDHLVPVGDRRRVRMALLFRREDGYRMGMAELKVGENRRLQPDPNTGAPCLDGVPVEIGGGKLMLKRSALEKIAGGIGQSRAGRPDIGPDKIERLVDEIATHRVATSGRGLKAYLSLAVRLPAAEMPSVLKQKKTLAWLHEDSSLGKMARYVLPEALVRPEMAGLRVLGVDLGIRHAACAAVLELVRSGEAGRKPTRTLPHVEDLSCRIEGSFPLKAVEGEGDNPPIRLVRAERLVKAGRWAVGHVSVLARSCKRLERAYEDKDEVRLREEWSDLRERYGEAEPEGRVPWQELADDLRALDGMAVFDARERWMAAVARIGKTAEPDLVVAQKAWNAAEELARALHPVVRRALAHPASLESGRATRERRALKKAGKPLPPLPRFKVSELESGGLSIRRLELLENALRYERQFATRARRGRSGQVLELRLSRGQGFRRKAREKLLRMKADRCKKIAAAIVEAALGGPPDKLTGKRPGKPCQVIALEDLNRYTFHADRPKSENRRLISWSHREIFKWVCMQAEPHGLLVAAVPAGYSSRFSGLTGAPGARVERLKEEWLDAPWFKEELERRKHLLANRKPGDWIVRNGGPEFVAIGNRANTPFNADQNAAINIAWRFFCPPAQAPVYLRLKRDGDQFLVTTRGVFEGKSFVSEDGQFFEEAVSGRGKKRSKSKKAAGATEDEEMEENDLSTVRVFRDPTGSLFQGRWTESGKFWGAVESMVANRMAELK